MILFSSRYYPEATPVLFIITGESNSGSQCLNATLGAHGKIVRPSVQILNNTTLTFQDLHIGVNNTIGHWNLPDLTTYGMEHWIAAEVESETMAGPAYVVKTGQGGSQIVQWTAGYGMGFWEAFYHRVTIAQGFLSGTGYRTIIFYSQGINDILVGRSASDWKAATVTHLAHMRSVVGDTTTIVMTKFMPPMSSSLNIYNQSMDEIAYSDPYTMTMDTTGAPLEDIYHWNYAGFNSVVAPSFFFALRRRGLI